MSGPTDAGWQIKSIPLKFQISYLTLGSVPLRLACRSARLDEQPLAVDELPRCPAGDEDGIYGYAVWSQPIDAALPTLRCQGDKLIYVPRQYRRYFVDLSGEFSAYLSRFSGKSRATLKRKLRKFAELSGGRIDWRSYRTPDEIAEFFRLATPLSQKTYQERLFHGGLRNDPESIAAALRKSAEDEVRAYLLFLRNQPIAYLFCPVTNGALIYDRMGYDAEYATASPGTVLQMLALEALFGERSHRLFDFTEGEGQHKEGFSTGNQLCADILVLNRRVRALVATLTHLTFSQAVAMLGAAATRFRVRDRIRRWLRGRSA